MSSKNVKEIEGPLGCILALVIILLAVLVVLLAILFVLSIGFGLLFGVAFFLIFTGALLTVMAGAAATLLGWPIYFLPSFTPFFVYVPVFIAWLLFLGFLFWKMTKVLHKYNLEAR